MNVSAKLGAFALALGVAFAGAYAAGALAAPARTSTSSHEKTGADGSAGQEAPGGHGADVAPAAGPGALAVSADGYTSRQLSPAPVAGQPTSARPTVGFDVEVPTVGTYRLFLDFQHAGVAHTAPFIAVAG